MLTPSMISDFLLTSSGQSVSHLAISFQQRPYTYTALTVTFNLKIPILKNVGRTEHDDLRAQHVVGMAVRLCDLLCVRRLFLHVKWKTEN